MATAVTTREPVWTADDVWTAQFEQKTDADLTTEIKKFESTAEFHLGKANKYWARANNGWDGYYYYLAKEEYRKAETCALKAEELRKMLAARLNTKSFISVVAPSELLRNMAVLGAALSAGLEFMECVNDDANLEETVKRTAVSGGSGYLATKATAVTSNFVTGGLKMMNVGGTAAGLVGGAVGMFAAPVITEVAKEVGEEVLGGSATPESLWASAEIGVLSGLDIIEETTGPARDTVADGLEVVSGWLDSFSSWLDTL